MRNGILVAWFLAFMVGGLAYALLSGDEIPEATWIALLLIPYFVAYWLPEVGK